MKKKGLIVLLLIFVLMFILNTFTPLLSDDYFSAFVWPKSVRLNDISYEAVRRKSSFEDIFRGLRGYYFIWGGRVPGGFPVNFFVWQGKDYFNPINAFMVPFLVAEIYWLSHEGKVSAVFNPSYLIWIFFALWSFNVNFYNACLWLAGSCNYLWMLVIVLAFLIPYVRSYFDVNAFNNNNIRFTIGLFFLGLMAGWSHETTNCWIIVMLLYLLYESKKKGELRLWKISGFIGFCLGYALLVFAPGNFNRLQIHQNDNSVFLASELIHTMMEEIAVILLFHFIIWYFIISFFFKYKKHKEVFCHKDTALYLNIAKLFVLIAFCSGLLLFLIPSNRFRPSFLNLAYLIIASAFLFRLQEVNGAYVINDRGRSFLKCIGSIYLAVTVFFSVWGNYINYNHLQNILVIVKEASKQTPGTVLEVPPSITSQSDLWLLGSGFHLVPLPISEDDDYEINKTFSYYYGIKGIKVVK